MAFYELVRRAAVRPLQTFIARIEDATTRRAVEELARDHQDLAVEVRDTHNIIQSGGIAVAAGATTLTVPIKKMPNALYIVCATVTTFNAWTATVRFTSGSRTTTSFGLTFSVAAPAGAGGIVFWHVIG